MESIDKIKHLVNLAAVDGEVTEAEKQFILNIGVANHMLVPEILPLFTTTHPMIVFSDLTMDQKFEYILLLMQLVKIDAKLYREELLYCARIINKLGYREQVLFELLDRVSTEMTSSQLEDLRKKTDAYLLV
ncbi:MAG TPA: hypothetical protein PLR06_13650 [Cyclobacteriaceae bacterium]|nr:hypothetical protein [Cyclobacteriaceae bacterium]